MRKLLVKIFNLVYLAGAIFAILSLCFEPLFKLSLDLDIKQEDLKTLLESTMGNEEPTENPQYRIKYRGEVDVDLSEKLTPAYLAESLGDIKTEEPLKIEIPASVCFQPQNQEVIKEVIMQNVDDLALSISKLLGSKLKTAIKNVVKDTANDIITNSINQQIVDLYGENSGKQANPADINEIVDNVYELFDSNENTSIDAVMDTISGKKTFTKVEEPLTGKLIEKTDTIYYVVDETAEDGYRPVNYKLPEDCTDEFLPGVDYYTVSYSTGMFSILQDLEDENNPQVYSSKDTEVIKEQMTEMLESQEGLTETNYNAVPAGTVTEADFAEENKTYYVLNGETGEYELATSFDPSATYYTKEVIIKNIDDALAYLLGNLPGSGSSSSPLKRGTTEDEESDLDKKIADMLKGFLHLDAVEELANKTVNRYTPLICTGILVLFAFPWVIFGLKTLIRTLRKKKCWTKFWFLLIFAFIQLVLGAVITLTLRFGLNKVLDVVATQIGGQASSIVNILNGSVLKLQFGCLMASYVYIAILITIIPYMIIAHRVKVEYKFDKRDAKRSKKEARRAKKATKAA